MRTLPIDSSRLVLFAAGPVTPKPHYADLSDGSRRRVDGQQAKDPESGLPLWVIDCFPDQDDQDERARAEVVSVTVPSAMKPLVSKFRPVVFEGLMANAYADRATGQVRTSFKASGVQSAPAKAA